MDVGGGNGDNGSVDPEDRGRRTKGDKELKREREREGKKRVENERKTCVWVSRCYAHGNVKRGDEADYVEDGERGTGQGEAIVTH